MIPVWIDVPNIEFMSDKWKTLCINLNTHMKTILGLFMYLKLEKCHLHHLFYNWTQKENLNPFGINEYRVQFNEYGKELDLNQFKIEIFSMTHSIRSNADIKTTMEIYFIQTIGNSISWLIGEAVILKNYKILLMTVLT